MDRSGRGRSERSRFSLAIFLAGFAIFLSSAAPAQTPLTFGTGEHLVSIQDVDIKGQNGEAVFLGYKYSLHFFLMPYSVSDDGYILGVKGAGNRYYPLDAARIAAYQARGQLPSPLPPYRLTAFEYVIGYSGWPVAFIFVVINLINARNNWRRKRASPYFESAVAHAEKGRLDAAIGDYTRAIEVAPNFETAFINRGLIFEQRGDFDRAIADYGLAFNAAGLKGRVRALVVRGNAYRKKGEVDRAVADYTKAIRLDRKYAVAYDNRGIAYYAEGDHNRAIADYTNAIRFGAIAGRYYNRGLAYEAKGDHDRAIADYTEAIRLDPKYAGAYSSRGLAKRAQGDAAGGDTDIAKAKQLTPNLGG
jgi:tetratricopeptide (TPR) repeat protein